MQDSQRGLFCYLILAVFLLPLCIRTGGSAEELQSCDGSKAEEQCGANEICVIISENVAHCNCRIGFERVDRQCVPASSIDVVNATNTQRAEYNDGGSSVAAGLLIPSFLVVAGVLLYFGARRYKWLQRFRQFRQNRYGNVLVTRDDDDDDVPPIP